MNINHRKQTIIISCLLVLLLIFITFSGCISREGQLVFEGTTRYYDVYIPSSYTPFRKTPLVIVLHFGGGNGEIIEEVTEMSEKAEKEGFIAVYPYGTGPFEKRLLTWNAGYGVGYAYKNNIDDVGFIQTLIDELQDTFTIDDQRIYITGFCFGASLTYRLGAELSDTIAAIAPISGSIGGKHTKDTALWKIPQPTNPLPVLTIHGMQDKAVPYNGGVTQGNGTYSIISVNESISFWVEHNNCTPDPEIAVHKSGNITIKYYNNTNTHADVVLYSIHHGGHAWPGGNEFLGGDPPTTDINATDVIWDFFKNHPKQDNIITRTAFVDPLETNSSMTPLTSLPNAEERNLFHYVAVNPTRTHHQLLFVNLPGSGGLPEDYERVTEYSASLGYHAITLAYPNYPSVKELVQDNTDPDLPEQIRRERLYGEDQTDLINVSYTDSISNRIKALLNYNHRYYPDERWDFYLNEDGSLKWDHIVVGGYSQGAGHAAYLTKNHALQGIIMFAGPGDYTQEYGSAPWLYQESKVELKNMFAFTHRLDPVSNLLFTHQELLGLDTFGDIQRVDGLSKDELSSHMLTSLILDIPDRNYHCSVVADDYLPFANDSHTHAYEHVWNYLFTELINT